jgi:PilZ domain-containing protein
MFRILAVEPDSERGLRLADLLRKRMDAEVVLAASAHDAIVAMSERTPDVILASALLTPHDDAQLTEHLKSSPQARDLPVLTIPPIVGPAAVAHDSSRRVFRFRRRGAPPWPPYDPEVLGARIEEALRDSMTARESGQARRSTGLATNAWDIGDPVDDSDAGEQVLLNDCGMGIKRLRAHRFTRLDLPWLSQVLLPWGTEAQLLNISSSGLLIESGSKFDPGSTTTFHLSGANKQLVVPARIVRSHVSAVDNRGVKYLSAAVFDKNIDLLTQRPASFPRSVPAPTALARLLSGVVTELEQGKEPAVLRATFEQGVRSLVGARDVELRGGPSAADDGSESIYFTVPADGRVATILQATFDRGCQPQEEEFRILKAAATLAGFLLQFADIAPSRPELVLPPPDAVVNSW